MQNGEQRRTLVLVRHGESVYNADQIFTGLLDVDLSERGVAQIGVAARLMADAGLHPRLVVASPLLRATRTAEGIQEVLCPEAALRLDWRLAERDYGCLTGVPKHECRARWGEEAFFTWRRTLTGRPPAATEEQRAGWPTSSVELGPLVLGMSESLADVVERVRPFWAWLRGQLADGEGPVAVVAHGNSLRALCLLMGGVTAAEVERLNIPAAQPLVFETDEHGDPLDRAGSYLDPATAQVEAARVAAEGGT
ncbi:2,3-bisphosphoglycerate-dependent phosphoglycerate mutase [Propionibacterium australiense]|uniref:2,3-bisphosphoglycerate-dependent phosphoglycerate mutase n=1 Tax=Propionibacterium australiense TaxID=119981 RepID=A0A383S320_9ACTN|nr:2,3-bisphosphoglycerate-dependent phosphoglycerate mutase [Propionibacterium australiense]SYZ32337.1 phosphoglycerate mutase --> transferred. Now recognized as two separate enzymes, phosphoglycerate mutase (2,3-diphosphoglycerate-dependent) and, phosphoglycerate mutase (2,3-diphosphoglycerate-independent) [Propionibacterium australiense]VEH90412.1 2,3-bisphosphoglycerate-dependent phosphoglycerate mutase [Propionibacterium australiense]